LGAGLVDLERLVGAPMPGQRVAVGAEGIRQDRIAARVEVRLMDCHDHLRRLDVEPVVALARLGPPGKQLRAHRAIQQKQTAPNSGAQIPFSHPSSPCGSTGILE
jgi:hypothetical protein